METNATLRGVRLSAQKGRLVADQIRGLPVDKALNMLAFSPKKGARIIKKVLESAIANAEHNDGADIDELKVTTIYVDKATTLQALRPRAPRAAATCIGKQTLPHPRRRRRRTNKDRSWDRRYIRPDSASRSTRNWRSKWFANSKHFAPMLAEDIKVREYLKKKLVARLGRQGRRSSARRRTRASRSTARAPAWSSARRARTSRRCAAICAG